MSLSDWPVQNTM